MAQDEQGQLIAALGGAKLHELLGVEEGVEASAR
eukprot:SAG31_NODE_17589_length_665_cov_1.077739_1_plen_33_part_10